MQKKVEYAATYRREINMEDNIFKMGVALYRCLLRLIENCCKGEFPFDTIYYFQT